MDSRDLKRRAEQLLREQWIPGLEQKTLMHAADELEDIVSQLTQREDPSAQTLLLRTRHLYDHAERQYFSGMPEPINSGLEQLMHRLEDLFEAHEGHSPRREATRYLLENSSLEQQRGLSALQADLTHFTHIPYSYLEASREEHQDVVGALQANNLPVIPEKHYHVHPLHAAQAQRNLELIGADKAWERARGTGVRVGIADTGVAYDHKELRERFTDNRGYNFVDNTPDPLDDHGHGTHVAGTVAGTNTGVAPEATLYALKFLNRRGSGSQVDFIRAAEWAIDHELHILNGSFGSNRPNDPEQAICDKLHQEGILFVAAAGNGGDGRYSYPASYDSVVSVAASKYSGSSKPTPAAMAHNRAVPPHTASAPRAAPSRLPVSYAALPTPMAAITRLAARSRAAGRENRRRTASPSPAPVTRPRRAAISCSTRVARSEKVRAQSSV